LRKKTVDKQAKWHYVDLRWDKKAVFYVRKSGNIKSRAIHRQIFSFVKLIWGILVNRSIAISKLSVDEEVGFT